MMTANNKDQVCETFCKLLEHGEDVHRTVVAQTLGRMGYVEAVPELVQSLVDEDEDVRTDAATALAQLGDSQAAEPLMQNLLGDPCWDVKLAAIDALTNIGHEEVVPWLRRMLKGKDEEIVWDESEFYITGWDDWVDIQVRVIKSLARFGDQDAVPDIVEAVDDEFGQDLSEVAFAAFGNLGEAGARALVGYATSDNARLRRRAVTVLGETGSLVGSDTMTRALMDDDADVREAAGLAIAAHEPADARLEMLLLDKNPEIRAAFVAICGRFHPERLSDLLSDNLAAVQAAALKVIVDNPEILEEKGLKGRLLDILDGAEPAAAALAARVLILISPKDVEAPLLEKLVESATAIEVRLAIVQAVSTRTGEAVTEALKSVLGDDQRQIRLAAMTALAQQSSSAAEWPGVTGEVLLAALRGEIVLPPEVPADEVIGDSAQPETSSGENDAPGGGDAMDEHDLNVSETIEMAQSVQPIRTVGEIAADAEQAEELSQEVEIDIKPGSTLAALFEDETKSEDDTPVESAPVELSEEDLDYMELTHQKPRRKVMALEATLAPHQDVRRYAARVLGDFPHDDVTMALAGVLTDDDRELVITALDSLAETGAALKVLPAETAEILLTISQAEDKDVRFGVSRALVHVNTGEAMAQIRSYLTDTNSLVRAEAIRGLALHDQVDAEIEACLADEVPSVRLAAATAMAQDTSPETAHRLVEFSLAFEAFHIKAVAALLAQTQAEAARQLYLGVLRDEGRKRYWKSAIEALEQVGRPQNKAALAA